MVFFTIFIFICHTHLLLVTMIICVCHNLSVIVTTTTETYIWIFSFNMMSYPIPVHMQMAMFNIFLAIPLFTKEKNTLFRLVGSLQYSQSVEMHSSPNPTLSHQTFSIPLHQIKPGPRLFDEMADALIRLRHERDRKSFPSKILKASFSPQLYLPRNIST